MFLFAGKVYSNKAYFDEKTGCLEVIPVNELMNLNKVVFDCYTGQCKDNICKGVILESLINLNQFNGHVIYVGDGRIDFCPGLMLKIGDDFFVKKNLTLARMLLTDKNSKEII